MPPEKISNRLLIFNAILVVIFIFFVFLIYSTINYKKNSAPKEITSSKTVKTNFFDNLEIKAKAVYVYDMAENSIIFQKNQDAQLPLASLAKLMTALVAAENAKKETQITIKKQAISDDDVHPISAGELWRLSDLLDFSLMTSSNTGMQSIALAIGSQMAKTEDPEIGEKKFIEQMNRRAFELGLRQTYFINESGLDESSSVAGAYGSAADIGKLLSYMIKNHPEILYATKLTKAKISSLSQSHLAKNTDTALGQIPNIIASKTGYTDLAGGNLAVAFDASVGEPIVVVILGSTQDGRFYDIKNIIDACMKYIQQK